VNHGSKVSILKEEMVNISLNVVSKMFERCNQVLDQLPLIILKSITAK